MELLLIDDQEEELSSEFSILNQLFEEYLSFHAKCQILIMSDEERQEDDHRTDSLDRNVFSIKRRIFDVLHSENETSCDVNKDTQYSYREEADLIHAEINKTSVAAISKHHGKAKVDSARQDRQGDLKSEHSSRKSSRKSSRTSKSSRGVESKMALEKARLA